MAQFTIYRSSDTSAPLLTGTVGSLVTVLDAVLVNGYGSKSAAGWTKAFSGTNKAAYQQASTGSGGQQLYFRILDSGVNNAGEVRATGYETMSDVDTGTNAFPTTSQGISGVAAFDIRKSGTLDSVPRAWLAAADGRTLYFFCAPDGPASGFCGHIFGDFYSLVTNDPWRCIHAGRTSEAVATTTVDNVGLQSSVGTATTGHVVARNYLAASGPITVGVQGDIGKGGSTTRLTGAVAYPNKANTSAFLSNIWVHENANSVLRGRLRGLWHFCHPSTSVSYLGDTITDGTTTWFLLRSSPNSVVFAIETSNTVETN